MTLGSASSRPEADILAMLRALAGISRPTPMMPGTRPPRSGRPGAASPAARPRDKDWTEARQAGVDLRRWWSDRLGGIESPRAFHLG